MILFFGSEFSKNGIFFNTVKKFALKINVLNRAKWLASILAYM
jgi:hypothetical protein